MTGDRNRDDLIEQLRARAADPESRTDHRPSVFESGVRAMSLGDLLSAGRSVFGDLMSVVRTNQAGLPPDPGALDRAGQFERDMSTPAPSPDLRLATAEAVRSAEQALGLTLPPLLARVYTEVADGGFGPGGGLLSLDGIVRHTSELRTGDIVPRNREWPATYLPLVHVDPGWTCVDTATGAILDWDPEEMTERMREDRWLATFSEEAPSVEAWLTKWLARRAAADKKPLEQERWDRMVARAQTPAGQRHQLAISRRHLEQVSAEDREKYGLDKLLDELEADLDAADERNR